jgi:hypothetical protein
MEALLGQSRKGKKKSEFMTIGNPFAKGINKAHKKSKGKPKGVCYYCNKDGHWLRNFSKYLAFKRVKVILLKGYMF